MPFPLALVLAAGTLLAPAKDADLPPIPAVFDDLPPPPAPASPPVVVAAPAPPPVAVPVPKPSPATTTLFDVPWIEGGSGALAFELSNLAGALGVRTGADLDVVHGPFSMGLGFRTGSSSVLALTTADAHGAWHFLTQDSLDFSAGVHLLAGAASPGNGSESPRTSVLGLAPEASVDVRLFPWLRARAGLSYRFLNAGAWSGPPGDRMGGLVFAAGLVFGSR